MPVDSDQHLASWKNHMLRALQDSRDFRDDDVRESLNDAEHCLRKALEGSKEIQKVPEAAGTTYETLAICLGTLLLITGLLVYFA